MSFSWNKWRQYIIEEASVNEETNREIIDAAVDILGKKGRETHYLHRKFKEEGSDDIDGVDVSNARAIIRKGGEIMEDDQAVFNRGPVDFGNDDESRFQYIAYRLSGYENHPQYKELQGYMRTMADEMDVEEGSPAFTQAFIKAMQIMGKEDMLREGGESLTNPEAEEISPEDLDAAADYFDSLEEDKFDKPGWDVKAIMDAFKEDFEEATRDTDDIPYAQSRVVDAYKDVFAKSHPQLAGEIETYLDARDSAERRSIFQNVADDPEVVGRDMMEDQEMFDEVEGETQSEGIPDVNTDFSVGTDLSAFDEAQNEMALEKAMIAGKLDIMQNDLEATLSQDEIDTLSDAIVLLRKEK